ncbi:MAG: cation-transporting P-type ATPase, partial [Gammaproteobacteria bacterium]|nr:cation-transporting P-type ATPase [Gammaproteobacteria bacterium]
MSYHTKDIEHVLTLLETSKRGLENSDAASRLIKYGKNILPKATHISVTRLFLKQFLDPLIYVLLFAAFISLIIGEYTDASFIFFVLFINALIGLVQEYSAQRSAASLDILVTNIARVIRSGDTYEINSEDLVPGDIVLLESGDMVPADLRLITQQELR